MERDNNQKDKAEIPELRIELAFSATNIKNAIGIIGASEVVTLLSGVKELIKDHMVLVYLDKSNTVMGIDAFLHNLEELMRGEANRALSRTITHFSASHRVDRVIIIQALLGTESPNIDSIKPEILANIAAKMLLFDITTQDIILMGTKNYFSYQENQKAWSLLEEFLGPQLDFLGVK